MKISFVVPGRPVAKERIRVGPNGHVYTPPATRKYEEMVGWLAKAAMRRREPIDGPVSVRLKFFYRAGPYGDVDNLAKAVLDGMRKIVYKDDGQVVHLEVDRIVGEEEKAEVEVLVWEDSNCGR